MTIPLVANRSDVAAGGAPLEALASVRERLIDASVELRRHPRVKRAATSVDLREYRSGSRLEIALEAELDTGDTLTWWMEISWDERWGISSRVYRDDDDGQTTLHQFDERVSTDPSDFVRQLHGVEREMARSIQQIEAFMENIKS